MKIVHHMVLVTDLKYRLNILSCITICSLKHITGSGTAERNLLKGGGGMVECRGASQLGGVRGGVIFGRFWRLEPGNFLLVGHRIFSCSLGRCALKGFCNPTTQESHKKLYLCRNVRAPQPEVLFCFKFWPLSELVKCSWDCIKTILDSWEKL